MINKGITTTNIQKPIGLLKTGVIVGFDPETLSVDVQVGDRITPGSEKIKNVQLPISFLGSSGSFIGGYPENGTPVIICQGEGNVWFILSFFANHPGLSTSNKPAIIPDLIPGQLEIKSDDNNTIILNKKTGILIGEPNNSLNLDTKRTVLSNTFDNFYSFTESSRLIDGIILRDKNPNKNYATSLRDTDLSYNDTMEVVALDPTVKLDYSNYENHTKNPSRVEKREIVYEFAKSFNVSSNDKELLSYSRNENIVSSNNYNRRISRSDAFSLSLVEPNYLIESIQGTGVDIYGNLLDLNRNIVPIGKDNETSIKLIKKTSSNPDDGSNVYLNIKRLERKTLAYHFEINARKDLLGPPETNDQEIATKNYSRDRSRFFLDIDKEGQLKLNVPASSETGNIPLLTRYENYSTINPKDDTKNPNDFVSNDNNVDILLDRFSPEENAVISLIDDKGINVAPIDRFSTNNPIHIKHGTVYHNIADTCWTFQEGKNWTVNEYEATTKIQLNLIPYKKDIVSPNIIVSGPNANAGGRSGSLNFDGSLEVNIGANTVDRHSLWLDTQGAIISNVGRDLRNNISVALDCDGEIIIQSGGTTPSKDSRFEGKNTAHISGAVDIRVFNNNTNEITVFRIDNEGLTVSTPGRIVMYSNQDVFLRSKGEMNLEAEVLKLQGRLVIRDTGAGSI